MHNYHDIGLKCSKYIPIHYKTFNFEKLYPKVFWCLLFAQLYGFLCSSLGFSMFSSLYSLISTFQELSRECRELIKESKDLNWNIFGAFQAYIMFMVHIHFKRGQKGWGVIKQPPSSFFHLTTENTGKDKINDVLYFLCWRILVHLTSIRIIHNLEISANSTLWTKLITNCFWFNFLLRNLVLQLY